MSESQPVIELRPGTRALGKCVPKPEGGVHPVFAFLGLPYAKPPVGDLRFQPPQKEELWVGDRDATQYGAICPQDMSVWENHPTFSFTKFTKISEDCLFLNIWSPTLSPDASKPVVVSIHGGGFTGGFGDAFHGTALVSLGDVVFVTLNYRLNAFGFFTTGDDVAPGNYGLLDQIEALRWIKANIQAFGGDPNNVTIAGESAGGMSVSALVLSPLARGLFRRAICQSGTLKSFGFCKSSTEAAKSYKPLLERLGCKSADSRGIINHLKQLSVDDILKNITHMERFGPVLDNHILYADDVQRGRRIDDDAIDLMVGCNSHEGAIMAMFFTRFKFPDVESVRAPMKQLLLSTFDPETTDIDGMLTAMVDEYCSDANSEDVLAQGWVEWASDFVFTYATVAIASAQAECTGKTFMYFFKYRDSWSQHPEWVGADHADELVHVLGWPLFDTSDILQLKHSNFDDNSKEMSRKLIKYWANFAKNGDPNEEDLPQWPAYTLSDKQHIVMDKTFSTDHHLKQDRINFFEKFEEKFIKKL